MVYKINVWSPQRISALQQAPSTFYVRLFANSQITIYNRVGKKKTSKSKRVEKRKKSGEGPVDPSYNSRYPLNNPLEVRERHFTKSQYFPRLLS